MRGSAAMPLPPCRAMPLLPLLALLRFSLILIFSPLWLYVIFAIRYFADAMRPYATSLILRSDYALLPAVIYAAADAAMPIRQLFRHYDFITALFFMIFCHFAVDFRAMPMAIFFFSR